MVKKLFLTAILLMAFHFSSAQVVVGQRDYVPETQSKKGKPAKQEKVSTFVSKFGVKAGLDLTNIYNSENFQTDFKMGAGFRIGAVANFRWGQRTENSLPGTGLLGFQPELLYSMQNVGSSAGTITMHSIQLPIMFKIYPTTGFNIEIGPDFSYIFSASPKELRFDQTQIKVSNIKGFNAGASVGIAYDFTIGLTVGARYTYNFTQLHKNLKWNCNNIQITIGWIF